MIHWQYLKGLYQTSSADQLWSYLYFTSDLRPAGAAQLREFVNTPILYLSQTNNATYTTDATGDCGHIITEKAYNQSIQEIFNFHNTVNYKKDGNGNLINFYYRSGNTNTQVAAFWTGIPSGSSDQVINFDIWKQSSVIDKIQNQGILDFIPSNNPADARVNIRNSYLSVRTYVKIGSGSPSHTNVGDLELVNLYASSNLTATGYCQAQYFNATSDKRAKINIQPLLINALDLVQKTQLYSFKYKETDTPSIGIIAQDVQNININGFKLVDNEDATGKDLDYMTIHESKLTYILWKAVQEQQKLIEDLQKEIKDLKKN